MNITTLIFCLFSRNCLYFHLSAVFVCYFMCWLDVSSCAWC